MNHHAGSNPTMGGAKGSSWGKTGSLCKKLFVEKEVGCPNGYLCKMIIYENRHNFSSKIHDINCISHTRGNIGPAPMPFCAKHSTYLTLRLTVTVFCCLLFTSFVLCFGEFSCPPFLNIYIYRHYIYKYVDVSYIYIYIYCFISFPLWVGW